MHFVNDLKKLARLQDVRCFILDMDGTFNLGDQLIEGSDRFYHEMVSRGVRILFLTNNSSQNAAHYVEKLRRMGCPAQARDVYTSGMAACDYLLQRHAGARVALLGNEHLRAEFEGYGIALDMEKPGVVCVGFDTSLDYDKLWRICDHVRAGLPFIATHPDFNCPIEGGVMPDIGAILAFIEASTGRRPDVIIGKPYPFIIDGLMRLTGLPKEALCICGDRLYTDIATGANAGILSVCVLSGEATLWDIAASDVQPDLVMGRLEEILDALP